MEEEHGMNTAAMDAAMKRFNDGERLPAVDPHDFQIMWQVRQEVASDRNHEGAVAIGIDYFMARGVSPTAFEGGNWVAFGLREMLVRSLLQRGVLANFQSGSKPDPEVFRAAATFPCGVVEISEALAASHLPEMPPEQADKLIAEMRAAGCDPQQPSVDAKFLSWMTEQKQKSE